MEPKDRPSLKKAAEHAWEQLAAAHEALRAFRQRQAMGAAEARMPEKTEWLARWMRRRMDKQGCFASCYEYGYMLMDAKDGLPWGAIANNVFRREGGNIGDLVAMGAVKGQDVKALSDRLRSDEWRSRVDVVARLACAHEWQHHEFKAEARRIFIKGRTSSSAVIPMLSRFHTPQDWQAHAKNPCAEVAPGRPAAMPRSIARTLEMSSAMENAVAFCARTGEDLAAEVLRIAKWERSLSTNGPLQMRPEGPGAEAPRSYDRDTIAARLGSLYGDRGEPGIMWPTPKAKAKPKPPREFEDWGPSPVLRKYQQYAIEKLAAKAFAKAGIGKAYHEVHFHDKPGEVSPGVVASLLAASAGAKPIVPPDDVPAPGSMSGGDVVMQVRPKCEHEFIPSSMDGRPWCRKCGEKKE